MRVAEVMSKDVKLVSPDDTIQKAAALMGKLDCGSLPVHDKDRLVGVITDRDIAVRGVATGKAMGHCAVGEVMSPGIKYVYEDETIEVAAQNMARLQVRRLPVLNRQKRLVGIVTLGDLAVKQAGQAAAGALKEISKPSQMSA